MRTLVVAAVLLALTASGCVQKWYEIEIEPHEDGSFARRMVFLEWNLSRPNGESSVEGTPVSLDEGTRARFAEIYGGDPDDDGVYSGQFRDKTPSDVGGAGRVESLQATLGTLWYYVERFQGSDDFAAYMDRVQKVAGRLTDLGKAWIRHAVDESHDREAVLRFLRDDLEQDLFNGVMYSLLAQHSANKDEPRERLTFYLIERHYLEIAELPAWRRLIHVEGSGSVPEDEFLRLVRRVIARKAGIEPDSPALRFLKDIETATRSYCGWYESMPEYARKASHAGREPSDVAALNQVWVPDALLEFLEITVRPRFFGTGEGVSVALTTGTAPIRTNGDWLPEEGRIKWEKELIVGEGGLPNFAFAVWAKPDVIIQERHFGEVILEGKRSRSSSSGKRASMTNERRSGKRVSTRWRPRPPLRVSSRSRRRNLQNPGSRSGVDILVETLTSKAAAVEIDSEVIRALINQYSPKPPPADSSEAADRRRP